MKPLLFIVEDDPRITALVSKNLAAAGFQCYEIADGDQVLNALARHQPALIVLDIQLPGVDGLDLTRRIRRISNVPILLLTARSGDADKVLGFEIGADDYVTKPFSTQELVARVRALLRRAHDMPAEQTIRRGDLTIDPGCRSVRREDTNIPITTLEFDLIYFLASRPGRVFSRDALMEQVWRDGRVVDDRTIDSLISRLRRKLEAQPSKPTYIQTVWGSGYRFSDDGS